MRKIYSLVLLAAALLVGTNAWAQTTLTLGTAESGATYQDLQSAINAANAGATTEIDLISDLTTTSTVWLGAANVGDDSKHIILDLNGHTYNYDGTAKIGFGLTHGTLEIKSTGTNEGIITTAKATEELICVYGTYEKINAKTGTPFAHLIVRENVKLESTKLNTLVIDVMRPGEAAKFGQATDPIKYACDFFKSSSSGHGVANGVRVDIYGKIISTVKYGIKLNGCVRFVKDYLNNDGTPKSTFPDLRDGYAPKFVNGGNTGTYELLATDSACSPYIYIASTGYVSTNETASNAVAAYASGYGRWRIEGYCGGSTGLYIKSGVVEVHDAVIESTNTETHNTPVGQSSGVSAGGSAVVVESNASYSGNISVVVSGDTKIEGASGYAIEETKTTAPTTEVSGVEIQGGTIVGGDMGAIIITDETKDSTSVVGGNFEGSIQVKDADDQAGTTATDVDASTLIPPTSTMHTTEVVIDGKTTVVVSEGVAPTTAETKTSWNDIAGFTSGSNAKWTGTGETDGVGTISGLVTLGELQILSATALTGAGQQKLTITSTGELHVNHLMMNEYAQIVVEAGGKLIVEGEQGILAPSVDNITLKATADSYAQFLFNPAVTSNRHPNATVELISDSYRVSSSDRHNQPFGVPTSSTLTDIYTDRTSNRVAFFRYDYENDGWENIGYLYPEQPSQTPLNKADLQQPFGYYQMLCTSSTVGTKVTMKGDLVGNVNHNNNYLAHFYMGFANSYTADIDLMTILPTIPGANKAVYIYLKDEQGDYYWTSNSSVVHETTKIAPMQAFIILNRGLETSSTLNYKDMVWDPVMTPSSAPARVNDFTTRAKIRVSRPGCVDYVTMIQDDNFTSEFDLGEAEKYMNDNVNIYVTDETPMSIFASNNIDNTYLGFACKEAGTYMLKFTEIAGENYVLVDLLTNAMVQMTEGMTYQFDAVANEANDYRFQIRRIANVVTDIETVDQISDNNSGIYTITGQYVGNMSIWNTLPSGLYIVDGVKKVK